MKIQTHILLTALISFTATPAWAQEPPVENLPGQQGQEPTPGAPRVAPPPAPKVVKMKTGGTNAWFPKHTRLYMGDFLDKEKVHGNFPFKNPTNKTQRLSNFMPHCQCAGAFINVGKPPRRYELHRGKDGHKLLRLSKRDGQDVKDEVHHINVEPGESGNLEVYMHMGGFEGLKESSLQFSTSDKSLPLILLKWQALGIKLFSIKPRDFFLNEVRWDDQKSFRFEISSSQKPDFKLLGHNDLPDYVKVKKKQIEVNGKKVWEVTGTFGPKVPTNAGGVTITYKTDFDNREIKLNVAAQVVGPIQVTPGQHITLGLIRKGKGTEKKVIIMANGKFALDVESIRFKNLKVDKKFIKVTHEFANQALTLNFKVLPEVKDFFVRGEMLVKLNHPAVPELKFSFNGIVR